MGASGTTLGPVRGMSNAQLADAIMHVLRDHRSGGLEALVDRFVCKGLGEVINSWISPLENQTVSVAQIRRVLGKEMLGEIAWQARMSKKEVSAMMASLLPQVVDKLTPNGRIPPRSTLSEKPLLHNRTSNR